MLSKSTARVALGVAVVATCTMFAGCFKNPLGTDRPSSAEYDPMETPPNAGDLYLPGSAASVESALPLLPDPVTNSPIPFPERPLAVTMYDVWSLDHSDNVTDIVQRFLASGTRLASIELPTATSRLLRTITLSVYRDRDEALLKTTTFSLSMLGGAQTVAIDPPLDLELGEQYKIRLTSSKPFRMWSGLPESYVFDATQRLDEKRDWSMRIKGWKPFVRPHLRPTRHALLVLLENSGVMANINAVNSDIGNALNTTVVGYKAKCCDFEFRLQAGETLVELIARVSGQLVGCLECLNPAKWTIEEITLADVINESSDYILEEVTNGIRAAQDADSHYDLVVKLEDGQFTAESILAELRRLAPEYVVDIHLLSHGTDNAFIGHNEQKIWMSNFFRPLMQDILTGEIPLALRSVYQMNCVGGTLKAEWRAVGVQVVNGTRGTKSNYMPTQYFNFMERWLDNETFVQATERAFADARPFYDVLYALLPNLILDSRLFPVSGSGSISVTSP